MTSAPSETPAPRPSGRCWTLDTAAGEIDVEVVARDDDRLRSVLPAVAAALGSAQVQLWHGSTALDVELPLTAPELAHGSVLSVGRPGRAEISAPAPSALELHVVGVRRQAADCPWDSETTWSAVAGPSASLSTIRMSPGGTC